VHCCCSTPPVINYNSNNRKNDAPNQPLQKIENVDGWQNIFIRLLLEGAQLDVAGGKAYIELLKSTLLLGNLILIVLSKDWVTLSRDGLAAFLSEAATTPATHY
jgi:hypothetical protein